MSYNSINNDFYINFFSINQQKYNFEFIFVYEIYFVLRSNSIFAYWILLDLRVNQMSNAQV
jgi:hypothetical protein